MRRSRTSSHVAFLVACVLGSGSAAGQPALPISTGVSKDTVVIGERFSSVIELAISDRVEVEFYPLQAADAIQMAAPLRQIVDADRVRAIYPLVAWVADRPIDAEVLLVSRSPTGESTRYRVPLAIPVVQTILPAGDVEPRPSRGVFPMRSPRRPLWPIVALALLAAAGVGWLILNRHGPSPISSDPRADALTALDVLISRVEVRAPPESYDAGARVLRRYLARRHLDLGEGWTTSELLRRASVVIPGDDRVRGLEGILAAADRAKFSGRAGSVTDAAAFLGDARAWIVADAPSISSWSDAA